MPVEHYLKRLKRVYFGTLYIVQMLFPQCSSRRTISVNKQLIVLFMITIRLKLDSVDFNAIQ